MEITLEDLQTEYNDGSSIRKLSKKYNITTYYIRKNLIIRTKTERKYTGSQMVSEWRRRTKLKLIEYKGGGCLLCGYNKCVRALQFHHIDSDDKEFTISKVTKSFDKQKEEVDKCVLVCSNCHCEIHDGIISKYILIDKENKRVSVV